MNEATLYDVSVTTVSYEPNWGLMILMMCVSIFFTAIIIVAMWKMFTKAGKPGWASLIPFYNTFVQLEIVGLEWWYFLLLFVPFVNFVVVIYMTYLTAKVFGKGTGFTIGLIFLPFIFYIILGFGDATYTAPQVQA